MTDPVASAQEAAVDVMRAAVDQHEPWWRDGEGISFRRCSGCEWEGNAEGHKLHRQAVALAALTSPTKKPCAEPDCKDGLYTYPGNDLPTGRHFDCDGTGFVDAPPPIEGLGWVKVSEQ